MDKEGNIGWDDEVSDKDAGNGDKEGFVVLPPGEYPFTVQKVERGQHKGSDKLPPCNMVKVELILDGGDKGKSYVFKRFFMHTKMLWKIYEFMTALGLHKKGEGAGPIPWSKVVKGITGRCKVTVEQYKGEDKNEVDTWIAASGDWE